MPALIPVPADWATFAVGKTEPDLCEHYRVCKPVIQRWRREHPLPKTMRGPDAHPRMVRPRERS